MKYPASLFLVVWSLAAHAQLDSNNKPKGKPAVASIGIGLGLDYGGHGALVTFYPDKHVGIFGGVGYARKGAGYNVGAKFRFSHTKRFGFVLGGMYGYNFAIYKERPGYEFKKFYYGPSFILGGETAGRKKPKNFLSYSIIIPIRPNSVSQDIQSLHNRGIDDVSQPFPVSFSLGYHFGF